MKNIDFYIANLEKYPLSGKEVCDIAGDGTRIIPYHELIKYRSIEELLANSPVIILFETKYDVGHYTALYYDQNDVLHFFDPYGMKPDEELNFAHYNNTPYLTNLLSKYTKPLKVNNFRYQKWTEDINTCGRHSGVRIRTRFIWSDLEYQELLGNKDLRNSPDWYVSALTLLFTLIK